MDVAVTVMQARCGKRTVTEWRHRRALSTGVNTYEHLKLFLRPTTAPQARISGVRRLAVQPEGSTALQICYIQNGLTL